MSRVSLTSSINGAFLDRLSKSLSSGEGSTSKSSSTSLATTLRLGARQYGTAIRTLNSAATVIDSADDKLAHLEKLTDKLIGLAEKALKAGGQSARSSNSEYRKIAIEFQKVIKGAKVGDIDILTRPGLEELFKRVGLDPEKAEGLSAIFDKFLVKGSKELLAAEDIKGKRPVYAPSRPSTPSVPEFDNAGTAVVGTTGGSYSSPTTIAILDEPEWMEAGDFNGDGIPDLVASSQSDMKTAVYLGNGDGTFRTGASFDTDHGTSGVVVDLDNDGKLDFVVNNDFENALYIYKGNGDGTFSRSGADHGGYKSGNLTYADFNNDGKLDLYFVQDLYDTAEGAISSIAFGNGDGTFKAIVTSYSGPSAGTVAIGDFNGDGIPDIAMANTVEDTFFVTLGNGNGTFKVAGSFDSNIDVNVATADFDGDGILDIISNGHYTDDVVFHKGNGDGTFRAAVSYAAGIGNWSQPRIVDLNGDGKLDVMNGDPEGSSVFYLLGNGDGTFKAVQSYASQGARKTAVADFDRDGVLDIISTGFGSGTAASFASGAATPSGPSTPGSNSAFVGQNPMHVVSADLNGDGFLDFGTADSTSQSISVVFGNGDGTFKARQSYQSIGNVQYLQFGDVTGDGVLDLVASHASGGVAVLTGNANGTFKAAVSYAAGQSESLVLKDVNGDNQLDLLTLDKSTNKLNVSIGNGNGSFKAGTSYTVYGSPVALTVGDIDGDGKQDVGIMGEAGVISLLMGTGSGSFKAATSLQRSATTGALGGSGISFADVNGDSLLDLVNIDSGLSVAVGNGDGTFRVATTYATGSAPSGMVIKDSDGDGKLDIHVANFGDNTVDILKGNGDGSFAVRRSFTTGRGTSSVTVGDFNGDGKADIISSNATDNTVSFLSNKGANDNSESTGGRRRAKEITSLFATSTTISTREGAAIVLSDLKALKNQLKENRKIIKEVKGVVGQNIELARATGMTMLNLSSVIRGTEQADQVAAEIRKGVMRGAPGSLSQLGNLEPIIVASLTIDKAAE